MHRTQEQPTLGQPVPSLHLWGAWSTIVGLLLLDRFAKWVALSTWAESPMTLLPGLHLTFLLNPGIAFSIPFGGIAALAVTIVVIIALCWWVSRALRARDQYTLHVLALLLAGAASNAADRLLYGGVIDYIALGPLPVFNLADLCVCVGVVLLLFRKDASKVAKS